MGKTIADKDWASTPLGAISDWPSELKCAVSLILDSKFPHLIAWGDDLRLVFNDAYSVLFEEPDRALGERFENVWADAWLTVGPIARSALDGNASYFEDLSIKMPRLGRWQQTWWTFSYSPIRMQAGGVGGIFCTVSETTAHKMVERQLEESEQSLRRFADLVPAFMWESDGQGRFRYMNRRMLAFTGLAGPEAAKDWTVFTHPDDVPHVVTAYAKALDREGGFECQHRIRAGDGSFRWFLARAVPVRDDGGAITGWYGCATDIHNWRLAIDQLRQSEEMVRLFAENAARILWIADIAEGRVEFLNAVGRRFWDGHPSQLHSWDDWFRLVTPEQQALARDALDRLKAGETVTGMFRVPDGTGAICELRVTLFPIVRPDGPVAKFGGIADVVNAKARRLVHLVDPDRTAHRELSAKLWQRGFEVRGFTETHAFAKVAPALLPGCVIIRAATHTSWLTRVVAATRQHRGLRVVVLTEQHHEADHVRDLMKQGACDVLPHDADWDTLIAAINEATAGLEETTLAAPERMPTASRMGQLSVREREILGHLMNGATNKVVAIELGISPRTVETHRARILEKLDVGTLAEAIALTAAINLSSSPSGTSPQTIS